VSSIAWLSIVTSDRAIDDVRVGKRHGAVSRVARLSVLIFDRQFLTERKRFDRVVRYALGPMPYALCPMPYARQVPHVTEKGYSASRENPGLSRRV
jgi:hypothetical protein